MGMQCEYNMAFELTFGGIKVVLSDFLGKKYRSINMRNHIFFYL